MTFLTEVITAHYKLQQQATTMYARTYNNFRRITIEAADCEVNTQNVRGDLLITVEPKDELYNNPNTSTAGRAQTLTQTLPNNLLNIAQALQTSGIPVDTDPQPSTSFDSVSPVREDPIHDPNSPQSPNEIAEAVPPRQIPLEPRAMKDEETQTYVPGFRHITEFIFSPEFQHNLDTCGYDFDERAYDRIRAHPRHERAWFLQVLNRFPGLIADNGPFFGSVIRTPTITVREPPSFNENEDTSFQAPTQASPRNQTPPHRPSTIVKPKPTATCSKPPQSKQNVKNKAQKKQTPPPVEEPSLSDTSTIAYTNSPQTDPDMERPITPGGSTTVYDYKRGHQHFTITRTPDYEQVTSEAEIHKQAKRRKKDKPDRQ